MIKKSSVAMLFAVSLAAIVGLGIWYWQRQLPPVVQPVPEAVTSEAASAPAAPSPAVASAPSIKHPIQTAAPAPAAPAAQVAEATDARSLLISLFGKKSALSMFLFDDFPRRLVTTVDNLGRSQAISRLWPMNPAKGRFLTRPFEQGEVISPDNSVRYTPYVLLLERVDLAKLAAAYRLLYPQLQTAYEELGYPRLYFNDRMVEVLDQLIATPVVKGPIRVRKPVINGPVQPPRPWVLYEFEDPALQALTAGQRIMVRMGPVNDRRLKAKLGELRRLLATGAPSQ